MKITTGGGVTVTLTRLEAFSVGMALGYFETSPKMLPCGIYEQAVSRVLKRMAKASRGVESGQAVKPENHEGTKGGEA